MFGDHGLRGLLKEYAHGKSPKCLGRNLGDFGEFCKGLNLIEGEEADEEKGRAQARPLGNEDGLFAPADYT